MVSEIVYVYPIKQTVSFTLVAKRHIDILRSVGVKILELDEECIRLRNPPCQEIKDKIVITHPIFYTYSVHNVLDVPKCVMVKKMSKALVGFDVCDTDRISSTAVKIANMYDLIIVPSTFCKQAYIESGVETNIEVIPHGISEKFMRETKEPQTELGKQLLKQKQENNYIYVLFFLWHSGYRKGADLVYYLMKRVQKQYKNVILLIKRTSNLDPLLGKLKELKHIEVAKWCNEDELVDIYDVSDICLVLSRGGGFELNALESLARGVPTLVPKYGCFLDYIEYTIPIEIEKLVKIYERNPIHIGDGFEVCLKDAYEKICDVLNNLEHYKEEFTKRRVEIWRRFNWKSIGINLINTFTIYGII